MFGVFIEGLLSVLSPCVIPILPVLFSILTDSTDELENKNKGILINTITFLLGICVIYFSLAYSFASIGKFMIAYHNQLRIIGGVILVVFGLFQLDLIKIHFLMKDYRKNDIFDMNKMRPLKAFLLGLAFSFGWTPCIGPALSGVLILAAETHSIFKTTILITTYTIGFIFPFVILLTFFKDKANHWLTYNKKVFVYGVKIGGVILVLFGVYLLFGLIGNELTNYHNQLSQHVTEGNKDESKYHKLIDFKLTDQSGEIHSLSQYQGKVVFLNFWATWCGPCRSELLDIQMLYEKYKNSKDVSIITVTLPGGREKNRDGIIEFAKENGYSFPILFDENEEVFSKFKIRSFPTTYMIDRNGQIFIYEEGALNKEFMEKMIDQTKAASK